MQQNINKPQDSQRVRFERLCSGRIPGSKGKNSGIRSRDWKCWPANQTGCSSNPGLRPKCTGSRMSRRSTACQCWSTGNLGKAQCQRDPRCSPCREC